MVGILLVRLACAAVGNCLSVPYVDLEPRSSGDQGFEVLFNRTSQGVSTSQAGWHAWMSIIDVMSFSRLGWGQFRDVGGLVEGKLTPDVNCAAGTATLTFEVHNLGQAPVDCNISFGTYLQINGVEGSPTFFWDDMIGVFESADGFWVKADVPFSTFCSLEGGCTDWSAVSANDTADSGADAVERKRIGAAWKGVTVGADATVIRTLTFSIANPNAQAYPPRNSPRTLPPRTPMATATASQSPTASRSPCPNAYFTGEVVPTGGGGAFKANPYPFANSTGVFTFNNNAFSGRFRLSSTTGAGNTVNAGVGQLQQGVKAELVMDPVGDCPSTLSFLVNISSTAGAAQEVDIAYAATVDGSIGTWTFRGYGTGFRFVGSGLPGEAWVLAASDVIFSNLGWGATTSIPTNPSGYWAVPSDQTPVGSTPGWFSFSWTHIVVPPGGWTSRRFVLTFDVNGPDPFPLPTPMATRTPCPRPYFLYPDGRPVGEIVVSLHDEQGESENATMLILGNGGWSAAMVIDGDFVVNSTNVTMVYSPANSGVFGADGTRVEYRKRPLLAGPGPDGCGDSTVTVEVDFANDRAEEIHLSLQFMGNVQLLGDPAPEVDFLPGGRGLGWPVRRFAIVAVGEPFSALWAGEYPEGGRIETFNVPPMGVNRTRGDSVTFAWNITLAPGATASRVFRFEKWDPGLPTQSPVATQSPIPATNALDGSENADSDGSGLSSGAIAGIAVAAAVVVAAAAVGAGFALCGKKKGAIDGDEGEAGDEVPAADGEAEGADGEGAGDAEGKQRRRKRRHGDDAAKADDSAGKVGDGLLPEGQAAGG